jgi:ring-1,2-phenylacetyl-CoA epoxidase subunit PaaE
MAPLFSYEAGQYLTISASINNEEVRRSYSMCSSPITGEKITIAIKKVDGGRMSNYLNNEVSVGDKLEVMPPLGSFVLDENAQKAQNIVLWGGGSGITPLFSIIKTSLINLPDCKCLLIYANRDEDNIIFNEELDSLAKTYSGRFSVIYSLDNPKKDWSGMSGYLNHELVSEITRKELGLNYPTAHYYTCGPRPMMDIVVDSLKSIGVRDDNIHTEYFTAVSKNQITDEEQTTESNEVLDRSIQIEVFGQKKEVLVKVDQTILEAAQDAGMDPPYSCTVGVCTTCRARLRSGKASMDEREGLSDSEIDEGFVLTCQAHPLTDDVDLVFE